MPQSVISTINIAHPPLTADEAEVVLGKALRVARLSTSIRILRIIHGYGSTGKGGSLKVLVKNFCYVNRNIIRASLDCGQYTAFDRPLQDLASACECPISDLDPGNDGVTLIWIR